MSNNLIVIVFEEVGAAEQVHEALVKGKKEGLLQIDDAAVVEKDQDGKVHVKNQISRGTWMSTGVGGLLGLLIAPSFFPLAGWCWGLPAAPWWAAC